VRYTIEEIVRPLFNKSVIFVEFPVDKFSNFTCEGLAIYLMYLNDENEPEIVKGFESKDMIRRD
jgi:hypothetical protein